MCSQSKKWSFESEDWEQFITDISFGVSYYNTCPMPCKSTKFNVLYQGDKNIR